MPVNSNKKRNIADAVNNGDAVWQLFMENYFSSKIINNLTETLIWIYYTRHAERIYKIDKGSSREVISNSSTKQYANH